jgi:hypothetical protein
MLTKNAENNSTRYTQIQGSYLPSNFFDYCHGRVEFAPRLKEMGVVGGREIC